MHFRLEKKEKKRCNSTTNSCQSSLTKLFLILNLVLTLASVTECLKYDKLFDGVDYTRDLNNDDSDSYALDVAIKLKREYADELVSDLFATSHGIEKVARVSSLG